MSGRALIDGPYRYWLTRDWNHIKTRVCWIMLNPSTADASLNDPTIRRCVDFSERWGHGGLIVVNLYALRATDPVALKRHENPVGPENDKHIRDAVAGASLVVAAWGVHGNAVRGRTLVVRRMVTGPKLHHLGLTKSGHPKHPLYLRATTTPTPWVEEPHGVWREA